MLRMNADTRVDDCATPSNFRRAPVCVMPVRYTPSGSCLRDLVEDVHDLGTRALQLLDDFHARDEARLVGLEAVDLLDLLVELGDLVLELAALRASCALTIESIIR